MFDSFLAFCYIDKYLREKVFDFTIEVRRNTVFSKVVNRGEFFKIVNGYFEKFLESRFSTDSKA